MARWTDEMLDRLAEQVQANAVAIRELREAQAVTTTQINANTEAIRELRETQAVMMTQINANAEAIRELREAQALMMQIVQRQENRIEELRQDTRNIHTDIRQLLAILTRNYPNGRQEESN